MKKLTLLLSSLLLLVAACSPQATATQSTGPQTITIMTHDSFSVSEDVVKSFEEANNAQVVFLQSGDAGAVLNKAILTKDAPLADLLFGVDNTFLSRALEGDIRAGGCRFDARLDGRKPWGTVHQRDLAVLHPDQSVREMKVTIVM